MLISTFEKNFEGLSQYKTPGPYAEWHRAGWHNLGGTQFESRIRINIPDSDSSWFSSVPMPNLWYYVKTAKRLLPQSS
jgi:hypothetical protein